MGKKNGVIKLKLEKKICPKCGGKTKIVKVKEFIPASPVVHAGAHFTSGIIYKCKKCGHELSPLE